MKQLSVALFALALVVFPAGAESAAPDHMIPNSDAAAQCAPVGDVTAALSELAGEHIVWWGQTADDVTMMLTERPDAKTWTLLAVHDGLACLAGSGGTGGALGS